MGQLSPVLVPLLVGILFGAATISIAAWLILRSRIKAATRETGEARVEIATLSERARRLTEIESQLAECGLRLQEETGKVATLTEQNTRLPELQQLVESRGNEIQRLSDEAAGLRTKFEVSESIAQSRLQQNERLDAELAEAKGKIEGFATEQAQLTAEVARLTTSLQAELSNTDEKIALLTEVKGKFSNEFEILASSILEDKSKRFTAQNETNLGLLLGPLATKLQEFQKQVGDVYDKESKDRTALATQVGQLMELNQKLSQDAHDLTHALKGSGKTQGDWGEMILERVLEMAGLRKGQEYEIRETHKRAQPDVVIHLPENKHIVVDSKVSVTAYADYSRADSDSDKKAAVALHLDSVRRHIKGLSEKNYHTLYDLNSLDFVIMFVPVEPAFMLAISEDGGLCESAWKKNVLLVSPTTFNAFCR